MDSLRIADWLLEPDLNQLSGPTETVYLEPRATAVLVELAAHPGEVRSRDDLVQAVWGDAPVGESALRNSIWELRKAFGDDARHPRFIQTVPRRGYRLVAPVAELGDAVVKTLMVSDLVDSTRLIQRLGDERSALLFECCDRLARDLFAEHGGREIDKTDGYLALFGRPVEAVRFALAYHRGLTEMSAGSGVEVASRVGIHLGEVVLRVNPEQDVAQGAKPVEVEGLAKPLTARLMSLAEGGQTLLTRGAFDVARRAAEVSLPEAGSLRWLAHGGYLFRGVDEPVEVFEVGREGRAPLAPPPDSRKAQRVLADGTILGWRPAPGLEIPQRPNWALERKLGEGGFGEAWLTRHKKTGERRVFKFCVERELLRSLQREVTVFRLLKQALGARRDIARILDWNFDDVPYFLELEHSEDGSLLDWAKSRGGLDRVPLAARLEIVAQVAEALAAAHSVGVLHKDVKPGNILIAGGGQPRAQLTDFGIGRITDKTRLLDAGITCFGTTRTLDSEPSGSSGTRLYMAPEVLAGKAATIQADIYALGVVLYQVVVGELDRAVAPGWRRNVDDPLLAGDIAACVDGAPERRPASALEVAERLRSLDARRQRRAAERRAREQAEANRRALERAQRRREVLTTVAAATVLILTVVSVLAVRAHRARLDADFQRQQAEELITFMLGDLRQTLESVGRLDAMADTADKVLDYYASFDPSAISEQDLARRGEALRQIGRVHLEQGDTESAARAFREAADLARELAGRDPSDGVRQAAYADSRFWLGHVLFDLEDHAGALPELEAHRRIYQGLVENHPGNAGWRLELAYGYSNVGDARKGLQDPDAALASYRRSWEIIRDLARAAPEDRELQLELATANNKVGELLQARGELRPALERHRSDLEILQGLAARDPDDAELRDRVATAHGHVGNALRDLGESEEALRHFRAEVAASQKLAALDPSNSWWQWNLAKAHNLLGSALEARRDFAGARVEYRASFAIVESLAANAAAGRRERRMLANGHRQLASVLFGAGETAPALRHSRAALDLLEALAGEGTDGGKTALLLSQSYRLHSSILDAGGETRAAHDARRRALLAIESSQASHDVQLLAEWTLALLDLGRADRARPVVERLWARGYRREEVLEAWRAHGLLPEA